MMDNIPESLYWPEGQRIAQHLEFIDPVLVPLAPQLAKPPYKDLSTPQEFAQGRETLEPEDLIAVHLTDTFPENGVIHCTHFYEPEIPRYTIHFVINSVPPRIEFFGADWDWKDKQFAVLVPFDKLKERILAFNPGDTFVLEELELPEGTVILRDKNKPASYSSSGKAVVVEADYTRRGERLNGLYRAIYEQMIQMGYFPQEASPHGEWYGWGGYFLEVWGDFCKRNNIEMAGALAPHDFHWAGELEYLIFDLQEEPDNVDFQEAAKEFLLRTDVPKKYKEILRRTMS